MFKQPISQMVYDLLTADSDLVARVGLNNIVSFVMQPEDTGAKTLPYITIGDDRTSEYSTDTEVGVDADIDIHTWSRQRGVKETNEIQDLIFAALNRREDDADVDGINVILIDHVSDDSFMDPDGVTRHGISTYRVLMDNY